MNIYIKAVNKSPLLHEGWTCLEEFKNRGANVKLYEKFEEIALNRNTLLIADIYDTKMFFEKMGWKVDMKLTCPYSMWRSKYWKRMINSYKNYFELTTDLHEDGDFFEFPLFVKPQNVKEFEYRILKSQKELDEFLKEIPTDAEFIASEVLEFLSEWRVYVLGEKVLGCFNYLGDIRLHPSWKVIDAIIAEFKDAPTAYTLDVGVLNDGETAIVEFNHGGWSIGNYGLSPQLYVRMLTNGWRQILEQNPVL